VVTGIRCRHIRQFAQLVTPGGRAHERRGSHDQRIGGVIGDFLAHRQPGLRLVVGQQRVFIAWIGEPQAQVADVIQSGIIVNAGREGDMGVRADLVDCLIPGQYLWRTRMIRWIRNCRAPTSATEILERGIAVKAGQGYIRKFQSL